MKNVGFAGLSLSAASVLLVLGCSDDSSGPSSPAVDCHARTAEALPRHGCDCRTEVGPASKFPAVATCDESYAGNGTTICCKTDTYCICDYVGCDYSAEFAQCTCGVGRGTEILASEPARQECTAPVGGTCCDDGDFCTCDDYPGCAPGDSEVAVCRVDSASARCPSYASRVSACDR